MCSRGEQMNNHRTDVLDSENTLHILRDIEVNPKATQRELAQRHNISLGKMNFLINAFIDKGMIKVQNFKNSKYKLAYMYLLTAYGIKTKIHLTHKFFTWKLQQYERLKTEIENYKKELRANGTKVEDKA